MAFCSVLLFAAGCVTILLSDILGGEEVKKRLLSLFMCIFMLIAMTAQAGAADEAPEYMKIYHIDCGRKFFSQEELCAVIDVLSESDFTHLQLAFGNNGLRFLLDDMSVAVGDKRYESEEVRDAIRAGNAAYTSESTGELSQEEMEAIIAYAASKEVDIIPMLNGPGHMNALLYAMEKLVGEDCSYMDSTSTVDVCSEAGVDFAQAILEKYCEYFSSLGCRYFNMGADEYANDVFNTGSMGFGQLIAGGQYGYYVDYINYAASIIKSAGMTPMAFNDGIYFADTKSCGGRELIIDTDILICYWQSGWGGYTTRTAAGLASDGFSIINTNDDWYYVLGRREGGFGLSFAQKGVAETGYKVVAGDRGGAVIPLGSMLCLWCDDPGAEFSETEFNGIKDLLSCFSLCNPDVFELPPPELNREEHRAYISGYPDGSIRPQFTITRAETAAIFYRLLTEESGARYGCDENPFTDVENGAWYNAAVSTLAAAGIIAGYADGSFRPNAELSRAEFAALISRFAEEDSAGTSSFIDVDARHWATEAIAVAEAMGWISGYEDGSFRPSQAISRAEAVAIINRMLGRAVREEGMLAGMNSWRDNPPGTWYYAELQEAGSYHGYIRTQDTVPGRDHCYEEWTEIIK